MYFTALGEYIAVGSTCEKPWTPDCRDDGFHQILLLATSVTEAVRRRGLVNQDTGKLNWEQFYSDASGVCLCPGWSYGVDGY